MQISNLTSGDTLYKVSDDVAAQREKLATFGTIEAEREDLEAELDIQEGRYETLVTIESLVKSTIHSDVDLPEPVVEILDVGVLRPGEAQESPNLVPGCIVEFYIKEKMVASLKLSAEPAEVRLMEKNGQYWLEVSQII